MREGKFRDQVIDAIAPLVDFGFAMFSGRSKFVGNSDFSFLITTWERKIHIFVECWSKKLLKGAAAYDWVRHAEESSRKKGLRWIVFENEAERHVVDALDRSGTTCHTIESLARIMSWRT